MRDYAKAALATLFSLFLVLGSNHAGADTECVTLQVQAAGDTSGPWQQFVWADDDTRFIYLSPNQTQRNGAISWGVWRLFAGHEGFSHPEGSGDVIPDSLVPHATLGMLVVKIDNCAGHWYEMAGNWRSSIRVARGTNVWLAINDRLGDYGNNTGAANIRLCTFDPRGG